MKHFTTEEKTYKNKLSESDKAAINYFTKREDIVITKTDKGVMEPDKGVMESDKAAASRCLQNRCS